MEPDRNATSREAGISPPIVESAQLFRGGQEVRIRHQGEVYRLLLTRNGKLILNK